MNEKEFMQQVTDAARKLGWKVYHTYDSRRSEPGFPDLVLVKDRILFRELKRNGMMVTPAQSEWGFAIVMCGGDWRVWTPEDWDEIVDELAAVAA